MRRNIVLLFVCLMAVLYSVAQNATVPLVEEGRTWNILSLHPTEEPLPGKEGENFYRDLQGHPCIGYPYEYTLNGDTVMNGQTYKKLTKTDSSTFCFGLRQEGDRVYCCDNVDSPEYLVFDFGLNSGDIFTDQVNSLNKMRVERIDTIAVNGVERRVFIMWSFSDNPEIVDGMVDVWIEGIGCSKGPFSPFWWTATSSSYLLIDCYQGGQQLITSENFITAISANIHSLSRISVEGPPHIFDLQGRCINGKPSKGVYIEGGRKVLIK